MSSHSVVEASRICALSHPASLPAFRERMGRLLRDIHIVGLSQQDVETALRSASPNYEELTVASCAMGASCNVIISDSETLRQVSEIPVLCPGEFLERVFE